MVLTNVSSGQRPDAFIAPIYNTRERRYPLECGDLRTSPLSVKQTEQKTGIYWLVVVFSLPLERILIKIR